MSRLVESDPFPAACQVPDFETEESRKTALTSAAKPQILRQDYFVAALSWSRQLSSRRRRAGHYMVRNVLRSDRLLRRATALAILLATTAIASGLGPSLIRRMTRSAQGVLVAPQPLAVWKSPPVGPDGLHFKAEATFALVNRGGGGSRHLC